MVLKVARIALAVLFLAGASAPALAQPVAPASAPQAAPTKVARPPLIPTSAFTQQSGLEDMSLSPDGNRIALRATNKDGKVRLAVLDADTRAVLHSLVIPDKNTLEWFDWAGNHRVLVSLSQLGTVFDVEVRFTRLFVYDLDTRTFTVVGRKQEGIDGDDLVYTDPAGEYVLKSMQRDLFDPPAVWRFPLDGTAEKTGKVIQPSKADVWDWMADDSGVVRMGFQYDGYGGIKVLYRRTAAEDFKSIAKLTEKNAEDAVWDVIRIVSESDEGYVLKPNDAGQMVLRKFNYATRTPGEVVYAAPDSWDLSDFSLDQANKPLWAIYTDDHDHVVWFDAKVKSVQARLEKALKGQEVRVFSRAKDGSRMLVWAGAENDPGAIYVYTAATAHLDMMHAYKTELQLDQLAQPRAIEFKARDGTRIRGYLTLPMGRDPKNLPLIILPHGGPFGVRDKLDFDYEVQFLANRGYAVLQPNYRGSDGYGQAFEKLGQGEVGRKMQDDLDDGMDWAVAQGYADAKRVCVVGSSYGGYAAMWAVIRNPERYRCGASFAGVSDFKQQLKYDDKFFSREGSRKFRRTIKGEDDKFDLDLISPAKQVARLTRPLLLVHGEDDTTVPFKQFKLMRDAAAKAGKPVELLTFKEEGHGFGKEEDATKWLDTLGAFLAKNNPAD